MPDALTQTKFGRSIVFAGGLTDVGGGNFQPPMTEECLLEVNLAELAKGLSPQQLGTAGPLVFAVETIVRDEDWPALPLLGRRVIPLKLRFTLGSGGAVHQLVVDATPSAVVQIPANTSRVDVFWERLIVPPVGPSAGPWQIPNQVRVVATMARASADAQAHRTFLVPIDDNAPGLVIVQIGTVPRFARDVMVYHSDRGAAAGPYSPGAALTFWGGSNIGQPLVYVSGAELLAMMVAGDRYPIPGGVDAWQFAYPRPSGPSLIVVDFSVEV